MANNQINNEYVQKGYLKAYLANRGIKVVDYDEWEHLCDCIDDAKAADVRENVRGEWINKNKGIWNTLPVYQCSVCGDYDVRYELTDNFCPNCGADMRSKE